MSWRFVVRLFGVVVATAVAAELLLGPMTNNERLHYLMVFVIPAAAAMLAEPILARWVALRTNVAVAVFVVAIGSLALGAVASAAASMAMFINAHDVRLFAVVLLLSSGLALVMGMQLSQPLVDDVEKLGVVADAVAAGDLSVRTGIRRKDELGRTAAAIDAMISGLAAAEAERTRVNEARQLLFTSIGHDLRTPLAAMRASVESLQDGIESSPERVLGVLDNEVRNVAALIDQLTAYARIEAGAPPAPAELVSIAEITHEAVEAFEPVAKRVGVTLKLSAQGPAHVTAASLDVARAVRNIVDNAIEYTPSGGTVTVSINQMSRGPAYGAVAGYEVRVLDTGPGFPVDFRDQAFEPFTRADEARSTGSGHAGLGLAIVRGLVSKHGGDVWLGDGPGGDVRLWFPAAPYAPSTTTSTSPSAASLANSFDHAAAARVATGTVPLSTSRPPR